MSKTSFVEMGAWLRLESSLIKSCLISEVAGCTSVNTKAGAVHFGQTKNIKELEVSGVAVVVRTKMPSSVKLPPQDGHFDILFNLFIMNLRSLNDIRAELLARLFKNSTRVLI